MPSELAIIEAAIKLAKILVVDDEFSMRKAIRTLLLSAGVTDVHDAPDGESGLAAIGELDPDVVILDWQLAGMGGAEFVRRARAPERSQSHKVPIIMLTDHTEPGRVLDAMRLGVHEFLVRPVSGRALHDRLASVLLGARPFAAGSRSTVRARM